MIMNRPTWDEYFIAIAQTAARRASCSRASVGAVVVDDKNRIVSVAYNGAPAGERHCDHTNGGDMKDGHCAVAIHAEHNAILYARRMERSDAPWNKNLVLYVTNRPCLKCAKLIVTPSKYDYVYFKKIIYDVNYRPDEEVEKLLMDNNIKLIQFQR